MRKTIFSAIAGLALAATSQLSVAVTYTFEFSNTFSGTSPASPWATLTFTDTVANTVEMKVSLPTPWASGQFVGSLYFNYSASPNALVFAPSVPATQVAASILQGKDTYKADGDGFYDVLLNYPTSNSPAGNRFDTALETSIYTITSSGLSAANFLSTSTGSTTPYFAAMHIQGIPIPGDPNNTNSGWLNGIQVSPVPEPEQYAMMLAGLGLIGIVVQRKRRQGNHAMG